MPLSFPAPCLVLLTKGRSGPRFLLDQERVGVGRGKDNGVMLSHDSVSRHHAELLVSPDGVRVCDLASRNGVKVNGVPRREAWLQEGDRVSFGSVELTFFKTAPVTAVPQAGGVFETSLRQQETRRAGLVLPMVKQERHLAAFYHLCAWITDGVDQTAGRARWLELMAASLDAQAVQFYSADEKLESTHVAEGTPPKVKFAHYLLEKFQALKEPVSWRAGELERFQARLGQYHFLVAPLRDDGPADAGGACPVVVVMRSIECEPFAGDDRVLLHSACRLWLRSGARARQVRDLREENRDLRQKAAAGVAAGPVMLGASDVMETLRARVGKIAATRAPVLITGETGSGKEVVAHVLHRSSPRADKPFIKVNCAAIPGALVESELFGHVKGAFTDARADRKGRFLLAHGGTLFLDEVGELPLPVQAKLLRVLETGEVERLGAEKPVRVDVRVLAATNRDLRTQVRDGAFRSDLLYRLEVARIEVPPLRAHPADIAEIGRYFLDGFCAENGLPALALSSEAGALLASQTWPGNVRELRNVIHRCAMEAAGRTITADEVRAVLS